jgi:hypothetical protein
VRTSSVGPVVVPNLPPSTREDHHGCSPRAPAAAAAAAPGDDLSQISLSHVDRPESVGQTLPGDFLRLLAQGPRIFDIGPEERVGVDLEHDCPGGRDCVIGPAEFDSGDLEEWS